jgi:hypothetical protein
MATLELFAGWDSGVCPSVQCTLTGPRSGFTTAELLRQDSLARPSPFLYSPMSYDIDARAIAPISN